MPLLKCSTTNWASHFVSERSTAIPAEQYPVAKYSDITKKSVTALIICIHAKLLLDLPEHKHLYFIVNVVTSTGLV